MTPGQEHDNKFMPYQSASAFRAHSAVNVYVGKSPFGFVSESGCVMTPVPTFPLGVPIVTVGVEIAPALDTPTIVPVTCSVPPTRSELFIVPSMTAVAMLALIVRVDWVSCPFETVNKPKS